MIASQDFSGLIWCIWLLFRYPEADIRTGKATYWQITSLQAFRTGLRGPEFLNICPSEIWRSFALAERHDSFTVAWIHHFLWLIRNSHWRSPISSFMSLAWEASSSLHINELELLVLFPFERKGILKTKSFVRENYYFKKTFKFYLFFKYKTIRVFIRMIFKILNIWM